EAEKLGFARCILSRTNLEGLKAPKGMSVTGVGSVQELYRELFQEE
ncbi:MAG: DNA repair protein RadA, partial [Deltaproteobacteria bacterium]|nr:DNA repair protein RadA [Deltaproteobacteria bacterium]